MRSALRRSTLLLGMSLAALAASQAQAQVVTDISADTDAGFDTGTIVTTNGTQTRITGGEVADGNLFHSFGTFDLAQGDTATWTRNAADAGSILNIVNRVRSGEPSDIHGTLFVSDMPNADFWFINPAGVLFGEGASVQVPNAAYFSTAHEIGFGGGQRFSTVTPDGSTFSSAAPAAFGFLGGQGNIGVVGSLDTGSGATTPAAISFVAGNLRIDAHVEGTGTAFNFAAVGGEMQRIALANLVEPIGDGTIQFGSSAMLTLDGATAVADRILLDGAQLHGIGAGDIVLRANDLRIANSALIETDATGGLTGDIRIAADRVEMNSGGTLRTFTQGLGHAGDIVIGAQSISNDGGQIASITEGGGDGGDISVSAFEFAMSGGGLFSETYRSGAGGSVTVDAQLFQFVGGAIGTATYGPQDSGAVTLAVGDFLIADSALLTSQAIGASGGRAGTISVSADNASFFSGQVTSAGFDGGSAGEVSIDVAGELQMVGRGRIRSLAFGDGEAANVAVDANSAFMTDGTEIVSIALGQGNAGNVSLALQGPLEMSGVAQIRSRAEGDGNSGNVRVDATQIDLSQAGFIESSIVGNGQSGSVTISGDTLSMADEAKIRSVQVDPGAIGTGGTVAVNLTGDLFMTGFSEIQSSVNGRGLAGNVLVSAANATLFELALIRSNSFGSGAGGTVRVDIDGRLYLRDRGRLEAATGTESSADGGDIILTASELLMEGGEINSSSFGSGNGGDVTITVDNALIGQGRILSSAFQEGAAGSVTVDVANQLKIVDFGGIEAFTFSSGDAGNVLVRAGDLLVVNGLINSDTLGSGQGGNVTIDVARTIELQEDAVVGAQASSSGNAGNVRVTAGESIALTSQFSTITASSGGSGDGGSVYVEAPEIHMGGDPGVGLPGGRITSFTGGSGNAGNVTVVADTLVMRDVSNIDATAFFTATGNAGKVRVEVANLLDMGEFTKIESNNLGSGQGGDVEVTARTIIIGDQGRIRAPSIGTGDAGDVLVSAGSITLNGGGINTSAIGGGAAGSVTVNADSIAISNGRFSDGEIASFTTSTGDAGTVDITVGELTMNGGSISSSTFDEGNAGAVTIEAATVALRQDATISSAAVIEGTASPTGNAGSVRVRASQGVQMEDDSAILAATDGPGGAGSVTVATPFLRMLGGRIDSSTSSVGNAGNVTVDVEQAQLSGSARVSSNALNGSTGAAGNISFTASESLQMTDLSAIVAATRGSGDAGTVIVNTPLLQMTGGAIASSTEGAGDAGDVKITASLAIVEGDAKVNSGALRGSTGDAGVVEITANEALLVADDAVISASTAGPGNAGAVLIEARELNMVGGEIASFTRGAGNAGIVLIAAGNAALLEEASINSLADGPNTGDAGGVGIAVEGTLLVAENSVIAASTLGSGNAGRVAVNAGELIVNDGVITSGTAGSGHAGDVEVDAEKLLLTGVGSIGSLAIDTSSGDAGDVIVTVGGTLEIADDASITASAVGSGSAGIVEVYANTLTMTGGGINSFTAGSGDAGVVGVFVETLNMSAGRIDSASDSSAPDAGNAGSVFIGAGNANLSGFATIDSRAIAGNAGDVTLTVRDFLAITDQAEVSAATAGSGHAGLVRIAASELAMTGGAINSFSASTGDAGLVEVVVNRLSMSAGRIDSSSDSMLADAGDAGGISILANSVDLSDAAVIESTGVVGNAGDVRLEVMGPVTLSGSARISAAGEVSGNAGSVFLAAESLTMTGGQINSLTNGSGNAGLVAIDVGELVMTGGDITSSSRGPALAADRFASTQPIASGTAAAGDAGDVAIRADSAVLDGLTSINSISISSSAGRVMLEIADRLELRNQALISTAAFGGGNAGAIEIFAGNVLLDESALISSTADGTFAAGLIGIEANEIQILNGSQISTNSGNGPAGDIALLLPTDGTLRLAGQEFPGVITTSSGANTGGRIIISNPFLILSEGGIIEALGEQGGANVEIQSAFFIRSSDTINRVSVDGSLLIESNVGEQITGTEAADVPFLDASGILSGQCSGVRQTGTVSQFSSRVTGPYAPPDEGSAEAQPETETPLASNSLGGAILPLAQASLAPCG